MVPSFWTKYLPGIMFVIVAGFAVEDIEGREADSIPWRAAGLGEDPRTNGVRG